jgi:hypothetical protein
MHLSEANALSASSLAGLIFWANLAELRQFQRLHLSLCLVTAKI